METEISKYQYHIDPQSQVYLGHALEILKQVPDEYVDLAVTSPPYYGLRNYKGSESEWPDGTCSQLGLEATPELYVRHLMMIFHEVKRVLKKTGSFYLNIGDTYAGSAMAWGKDSREIERKGWTEGKPPQFDSDVQQKCMLCIPERILSAMLDDKWILRNKMIWLKGNSMPLSAKDRYSNSYELVYFFVKSSVACLWRNQETGEWRDTEPTKEEKYPWGGRYRNMVTGEFVWNKPEDMDRWEHLTPIWHSFDYYFDLDAVRRPHAIQSLERYQRAVNLGAQQVQGKYLKAYAEEGREFIGAPQSAPKWFQGEFPPDPNYKSKKVRLEQADIFGHGPNPQSFNLRVRDVKRGKGGTYVQDGQVKELKASDKEIKEYEYPEEKAHWVRPSRASMPGRDELGNSAENWRQEADVDGQLFDKPVAHQGGGNTGLKKHDMAVSRGSDGNVAYTDPLHTKEYHPKGANPGDVLSHKFDYGIGAISHRDGMDGIVAPLNAKGRNPGDVIATRDKLDKDYKTRDPERHINLKGINPGDYLTARQEDLVEYFSEQGSGGNYLYGGLESPEGIHYDPRGRNPGELLEVNTKPFFNMCLKCGWQGPEDVCPNCKTKLDGLHFAVFPEALVTPLILASCPPGGVVLDPFGGSGTVAVATRELGRKAILVEIVERFCRMTVLRLKKISLPLI